MWIRNTICIFALFVSGLVGADRALLVGVGEYPDPRYNLAGIDKDVESAKAWALRMGIDPKQIKILFNQQATLTNIRSEINQMISDKDTKSTDRILIYFSSHGSLNLDAQGKPQGVIVNYDARITPEKLDNVLGGPELGRLVSLIKSDNVLVVVDACHSGKLTESSKSLLSGNGYQPKLLTYDGMPQQEAEISFSKGMNTASTKANYVLISACRRDEVADATPMGSQFTVSLSAAMESLRTGGRPLNANELLPVTDRQIAQAQVSRKGRQTQHPELYGGTELFAFDWFTKKSACPPATKPFIISVTEPEGDKRWDSMNRLARMGACGLTIRSSKAEYKEEENLELQVEAPTDGYLTILGYGEGGNNAMVLFPNNMAKDNAVRKGTVVIPPAGKNGRAFELELSLPAGMRQQRNVVVAVFSSKPINWKGLSGDGPYKDVEFDGDSRDFKIKPAATQSAQIATEAAADNSGKTVFVLKK